MRNEICSFYIIIFFFFSSRRRHTRSDRDWTSDVCSSDLPLEYGLGDPGELGGVVNVDDGRTILGGSPTAQLAVNNLEDLETEKDPVIDVGSEHKVQLCFDGVLLDFGGAK